MPVLSLPVGRAVLRRPMSRGQYVRRLKALLGDDRAIWLPDGADVGTSADAGSISKTWTADTTMALAPLGRGYSRAFVSGSGNSLTTPNLASLQFGNSTQDVAFSGSVLAKVTDTAGNRVLLAKYDNGAAHREWFFRVTTADLLQLVLYDESLDVLPTRTSDAPIPQGAWHTYGWSYDGGGGATAANGITLLVDGQPIASTPTNAGTYVSIDGGVAPLTIGSLDPATGQFFDGSVARAAVCGKNLTSAEHASITALDRQFFKVPV